MDEGDASAGADTGAVAGIGAAAGDAAIFDAVDAAVVATTAAAAAGAGCGAAADVGPCMEFAGGTATEPRLVLDAGPGLVGGGTTGDLTVRGLPLPAPEVEDFGLGLG